MYTSSGKLSYGNSWLLLHVDSELLRYYRYFVLKYCGRKLNAPTLPHITVIAGKYEKVCDSPIWGKYHNEIVTFEYEPTVYNDDIYYWIQAKSLRLEEIRKEFGLTPIPYWPYHATIGNLK
jgi:hypothetical protein